MEMEILKLFLRIERKFYGYSSIYSSYRTKIYRILVLKVCCFNSSKKSFQRVEVFVTLTF